MSENRAADYIAFGMNRGVDRFLEQVEKRKEEDKNRAREFKALQEFGDATGLINKDQSTVMDADQLRGFVQGKMWQTHENDLQRKAAFEQLGMMRKLQEDQDYQNFIGKFNNTMQPPGTAVGPGDQLYAPQQGNEGTYFSDTGQPQPSPLEAFQAASSAYPGAMMHPQFASFGTTYDRLNGKEFAPGPDERLVDAITKAKAAGNTEKAAALEEQRQARMHPTGQDRFDLPYSAQLRMEHELNTLHSMVANPLISGFKAEADKAKISVGELHAKKLKEIEDRYASLARKPAAAAPKRDETPVKVKAPNGSVGSIPKYQLEQAKKAGYTVVE